MDGNTVVLACSSLKDYVEEAQRKAGSSYPVTYLNRMYHRDPKEMRRHILEYLDGIHTDNLTALVAMGFCGGSWADVRVPCRLVMPKIDDCVSLLLQTTDEPISNLKEQGHLYVREKNPRNESFHAIFERMTKDIDEDTKRRYHKDWMALYSNIDIMDTGLNDCRTEEYRAAVQEDADWLGAELSYVKGGTHLLEKLFSGKWDEQFLVLEKGGAVEKQKVLI